MSFIAENIATIRATLPAGVKLLCVSKYHPIEAIQEAYKAGERCFGESRVQELKVKAAALPQDIEWHFIGHLQTNKIRQVLPLASLIHGVDSWQLLEAIEKEADKMQRTKPIRVLLEVKVAKEASKYGFDPAELLSSFVEHKDKYPHVQIVGIMGMASNCDDIALINKEFATLQNIYQTLGGDLSILSMGMTEDYLIAIEHGSNLVRIGSGIFAQHTTHNA